MMSQPTTRSALIVASRTTSGDLPVNTSIRVSNTRDSRPRDLHDVVGDERHRRGRRRAHEDWAAHHFSPAVSTVIAGPPV